MSRSTPKSRFSTNKTGISWSYILMAIAGAVVLILLATWNNDTSAWQRPATSKLTLADIPINGERAYAYLKEICAIGPRVSATEGMHRQQAYLKAHFEKLGGQVTLQEFDARHPLQNGNKVRLANLIVTWHPEKSERILLCAHYDTRPFPDQDPVNPRGVFIGANDGGSGTALLCELAHSMKGLRCKYGVDFVLFDGEELVYDGQRDPFFLGSEHFAHEYAANPPAHRYRCGVLLDMVGDIHLEIYRETNSMRTPQTRQIVNDIWSVARELGVREFIPRTQHEVRDDHLALNNVAHIPSIDIIDFDYPTSRGPNYWHTTQDVPENCSALSLAKVGWVLKTWLEKVK